MLHGVTLQATPGHIWTREGSPTLTPTHLELTHSETARRCINNSHTLCTVFSSWEIHKGRQACTSTLKNKHCVHMCIWKTKCMLNHVITYTHQMQLVCPAISWVVSLGFHFMYGRRLVFYHTVSERNMSRCCSCLRGMLTSQKSPLTALDKTSQIKTLSLPQCHPTDTKSSVLWTTYGMHHMLNNQPGKPWWQMGKNCNWLNLQCIYYKWIPFQSFWACQTGTHSGYMLFYKLSGGSQGF